jgi:hypothetical protein
VLGGLLIKRWGCGNGGNRLFGSGGMYYIWGEMRLGGGSMAALALGSTA